MRRILTCMLATSTMLVSAATSQSTVTSPRGFASTEGAGWCYGLVAHGYARFSFQDGEFRNSSMALKQIAMRPDHQNYGGVGRRFWGVFLEMSECSIASNQSTWTRMAVTTPSRVFAQSVIFPALTGRPTARPLPFNIRFPFASTWVYSGRHDINADFELVGGVLDNNANWSNRIAPYYMDSSHRTESFLSGAHFSYGRAGPWGIGCVDGGGYGNGATCSLGSITYNRQHGPDVSQRGMTVLTLLSQGTARSRPALFAFGLVGGSGATIPGVKCNQLYVDLRRPTLYLSLNANNNGQVFRTLGRAPFNPALTGAQIYAQASWRDSQSGQLKLTTASRTTLPGMPPALPQRYFYLSLDWRNTTGAGPMTHYYYLPLFQYTR